MMNFECIDCEIAFVAPSFEDSRCPICASEDGVVMGFDTIEDFGWDGPDDLSADADALAGIGWGTDEDYGFYGGEDW